MKTPAAKPGPALALLLALSLAACGWRLAGSFDLPPELSQIHLVTENFSRTQRELLASRLQSAGAEVLQQPRAGAVRLRVKLVAIPDRRVTTGASTGKTVDRLARQLDFSLTDADGQALTEPRSLTQQRNVVLDDDELLSSDQERRNVLRELEQALFNRLLQQLTRL